MKLNILRNPEFDKKLNSSKKELRLYLIDKDYDLKGLSVDELIQWKGTLPDGPFEIFPNDLCPKDIKNIVNDFIKKEFE